MTNVDGLRSGYAKVDGLVYFGRMLDKIRLSSQGKLPPGYNLGDQNPLWFDGVCCRFLQIEYAQIVDQVQLGRSDDEILDWAYRAGKRPTEDEIRDWNAFMTKCGWRDQSTASLNRWKKQLGLEHRTDVHTFFDLYDADEGREIPPECTSN
jgi:gluconokinase